MKYGGSTEIGFEKARHLAGSASDSTRETMTHLIYRDAITVACITAGVSGEFMQSDEVGARVRSAGNAGEPVWMVVSTVCLMHNEARKEYIRTSDRNVIGRAYRTAVHS